MSGVDDTLLSIRGLGRRFGAVCALDDVSLDLRPGRVYGLIGENGAGKSTLMKIIAGVQPPSSGSLSLDGRPVSFTDPAAAMACGIGMVHQELNLIDELSVADNIFLGREYRRGLLLDRQRMAAESSALLARIGSTIDPRTPVKQLGIAERQLVEIAKVLGHDSRLIILDEPSAVLTSHEVDRLLALVEELRADGRCIIYCSHILPEVQRLADEIVVLRDGRLVATHPRAAIAAGQDGARQLASLLVGRDMADHFPTRVAAGDEPRLVVSGLRVAGRVDDVSFTLHRGEILGLAGLIGAGRSELAEAIAGLRKRSAGQVSLDGQPLAADPRACLRAGLVYVSEDRRGRGLIMGRSVRDNTSIAVLRRFGRFRCDRRAEAVAVEGQRQRLQVACADIDQGIATLSGGNQQKVAIGRWLLAEPSVLLLDEPTRGVDIGAKEEIYRLIRDCAAAGMAVLCISSELNEVIGLCHRIMVLRNGRLVATVDGPSASEEALIHHAAGVGSDA